MPAYADTEVGGGYGTPALPSILPVIQTLIRQASNIQQQIVQKYPEARVALPKQPIAPAPKPIEPYRQSFERYSPFNEPAPKFADPTTYDPFRLGLAGFSPLANQGPETPKAGYELLFGDRTIGESFYEKLTPEQQKKFEETRRTSNEGQFKKNELIHEIEKLQAEDPTLPQADRDSLKALSMELFRANKGAFDPMNPVAVMLRNLGTRAKFRKMQADWKSGKTDSASTGLPDWFAEDATGEEIDAEGGLGGFMQNRVSQDYVGSPKQFGWLIHTDDTGEEHMVRAEDWINLKLNDATPAPGDTPEDRARKAGNAAALIYTLSKIDVYNSFAKKRDAGYRVELDADGKPIRAYVHNDDKVALQNFVKKVLAHQESGVVGPIEEFLTAYALEYGAISDNATGPYGDGSGSRDGSSGSGYRSYGGYGGGGGGGGFTPTTYFPTPAEIVEPANGVVRARLGRALTAEEEAEFVTFFREMEASIAASGGMLSRLDPQSQAIAWMESRLNKEQAGQQAGRYVAALMSMMRSGTLQAG